MAQKLEEMDNMFRYPPQITTDKAITTSSTITAAGLATTGALNSTTETIAAAGAVSIATLVTKVASAGAIALTLANGTDGQVKIILMTVDGGDATLTPATKTGYSTATFNDAGDGLVMVYTTTTGWIIVGNNGVTLA